MSRRLLEASLVSCMNVRQTMNEAGEESIANPSLLPEYTKVYVDLLNQSSEVEDEV